MVRAVPVKDIQDSEKETKPKFVVRNPLFAAGDSLLVVRDKLAEAIRTHDPEYLFMPITADLEPFWELDVQKGWFNSSCSPFTALFMAVREYPREFAQLVDGRLVNYQRDYDKLLDSFNRVYIKALENNGSGQPKGTLSKDEFLRMTSLFYCLLATADRTHGMVFDKMGHLCNGWGRRSRIVSLSSKLASFYSDRLKQCKFTGVEWQQFMFLSMSEHRQDRCSWLFNLTRFDAVEGSKEWNFTLQDFIQILDMVRNLDPYEHQVTIVLQNTQEIRHFMRSFYKIGLKFDDTILGRNYSVVSNYVFARGCK